MKRIRDSDKLTNILYVFKKNSSESISKKKTTLLENNNNNIKSREY